MEVEYQHSKISEDQGIGVGFGGAKGTGNDASRITTEQSLEAVLLKTTRVGPVTTVDVVSVIEYLKNLQKVQVIWEVYKQIRTHPVSRIGL